jgi:hypothetical protein
VLQLVVKLEQGDGLHLQGRNEHNRGGHATVQRVEGPSCVCLARCCAGKGPERAYTDLVNSISNDSTLALCYNAGATGAGVSEQRL